MDSITDRQKTLQHYIYYENRTQGTFKNITKEIVPRQTEQTYACDTIG